VRIARSRLRRLPPLLLAAGLLLSCMADRVTDSGGGHLLVRFLVAESAKLDSPTPAQADGAGDGGSAGRPDSLVVAVRNGAGTQVAFARAPIPPSGDVSLEFAVPPGRDIEALLQAEGPAPTGRGGIYFGRQGGIVIERGRVTETTVLLYPAFAGPPVIDGEEGGLRYTVRWSPIPGVVSYLLREEAEGLQTDYTLAAAETARVFTPGIERGTAGLPRESGRLRAEPSLRASQAATGRAYRVRGELPLGTGIFSDSSWIDLDPWFDLPRVIALFASGAAMPDSAEEIADTCTIRVRFDRQMELPLSPQDTLVSVRALSSGQTVDLARSAQNGFSDLLLRSIAPLDRGTWYRLRVSSSLRGDDGRRLDQEPRREGLQAFAIDFRVEVYDPIRVIGISPEDGATDIAPVAMIVATLSHAVDPASVDAGSLRLVGPGGDVAASRQVSGGGKTLTLDPSGELEYGGRYAIRLETTIRDAERGEPLDQDPLQSGLQPFSSDFTVLAQPRGPSVASTVPVANEPHHPVYEAARVEFDRQIDPATFLPGQSVLLQRNLNGLWVNVALRPGPYSDDGKRFILVPASDLARDTEHRLIIRSGTAGVRDAGGIPFDQDYDTPGFQDLDLRFLSEQNVKVIAVHPPNGEEGVAWDVEVRLTFDPGVRPASVAETTVALLLDGVGVAAARFVSPDGREVRLRPDSPLRAFRRYQVAAGAGLLSERGGPFDQDYSLAGHQSFSSQFTTIQETVAPFVVQVAPAEGAAGIRADTSVTVVFSEPVRPSLVETYFHLTRGDSTGPAVAGRVVPSLDSLSARFEPSSRLADLTSYHVHIETLITDRFGNGLDQDPVRAGRQKFHSSFTTEPERIPPSVLSVDPADGESGVGVADPVIVDFSEPMDRSSLGTAVRVEISGVAHPGTLSFDDDDRRAIWIPAGSLPFDRSVTVVVDTLALDLAGNRLDQHPDPAHPGPDPFTSGFRTEPDAYGPVLVASVPEDGAIAVDIDVDPVLTFDEPLDPTTIGEGSIRFTDSTGAAIPAARVADSDNREVSLLPADPLPFESRILITLTPALADTLGNPFDGDPSQGGGQERTISFRTRAENIPPRVTDLLLDGGPWPAVDTRVRLVFSEPVDIASVNEGTFRLLDGGLPVDATRTVSASGDTATLAPAADLQFETTYTVRAEGVLDRKGNRLDQDPSVPGEQAYEASFTTVTEQGPPPRVVSSLPGGGDTDVDPLIVPRLVFSKPMDLSSFTPTTPGLIRNGFAVSVDRQAEPGDTAFVFLHAQPLQAGRYQWLTSMSLRSADGARLDQDPAVPGNQPYLAEFEVGARPVADAGPGVCALGDSRTIVFDASGSTDPDGTLVSVTWDWGDGSPPETLPIPAGLSASHTYACTDTAGCDGRDSDGDGEIDETGEEGCDESYHVIMSLEDSDDLRAADTTGVSFCSFLVRRSDPSSGAAAVDTLKTIRVTLSRACDPSTVDPSTVWLEIQGGGSIELARSTEDGDRILVLDPAASLLPDTTYTIRVASMLRAPLGEALDQEPCVPAYQGFASSFQTVARAAVLLAPRGRERPAEQGSRETRP